LLQRSIARVPSVAAMTGFWIQFLKKHDVVPPPWMRLLHWVAAYSSGCKCLQSGSIFQTPSPAAPPSRRNPWRSPPAKLFLRCDQVKYKRRVCFQTLLLHEELASFFLNTSWLVFTNCKVQWKITPEKNLNMQMKKIFMVSNSHPTMLSTCHSCGVTKMHQMTPS
jgi:hypothetical protein